MYNAEKGSRTIKELVIENCWQYLYENMHKFNETNRLKVALELCKKSIPTELTGEVKGLGNHVVIIERERGEQATGNRLPADQTTDISVRPAE
jgi:hypothetical protein